MSCERIFNQTSYLDFIHSEVVRMKSEDPSWNVSKWAQAMGFMNVTALHLIIKGKRRPGEKAIPRFTNFFRFSEREEKYFRYLIKKDLIAKDPEISHYLDLQLKKLTYEDRSKLLEEAQFKFIAEWYHFAIRQMVSRGPLKNDPQAIKAKLLYDVSVEQVQKALDNLCSLDVIQLRDGYYHDHIDGGSVRTTENVSSEALKQHHEQMISNAKKAVRAVPVEERYLHGRTLVMNKSQFDKVSALVREFSEHFSAEMDRQDGNQVYQLNVQVFPLSQEL